MTPNTYTWPLTFLTIKLSLTYIFLVQLPLGFNNSFIMELLFPLFGRFHKEKTFILKTICVYINLIIPGYLDLEIHVSYKAKEKKIENLAIVPVMFIF